MNFKHNGESLIHVVLDEYGDAVVAEVDAIDAATDEKHRLMVCIDEESIVIIGRNGKRVELPFSNMEVFS